MRRLKKSSRKQYGNPFSIKQFRCHDRSIINAQRERTYYLEKVVGKTKGGKDKIKHITVAQNRHRRTEQNKYPAFDEWCEATLKELGKRRGHELIRQVKVRKSKRRYNNMDRTLPGAVFYFEGQRLVVSGNSNGSTVFRTVGQGKKGFSIKKSVVVYRGSLTYL